MSFLKRLLGLTLKNTQKATAPADVPVTMSNTYIISKVTPFDLAPNGTFTPLLAEGWILEGAFTMWEVAEFVRETRVQFPQAKLFAILEDVGQAFYTSGHTLDRHNLSDIDPESVTGIHPSSYQVFSEGEPPEFYGLTHPSEFPIRHKMFMDFVEAKNATSWQGELSWSDGENGNASLLCGMPLRPELPHWDWKQDRCTYVMRIPVSDAAEAISVFPNGYFSEDLQPDQNYYLAKALDENFGLQIFGIGATYVGFMRDSPLNDQEAAAFGVFLKALYSADTREDISQHIANIVRGQSTLFLAYGSR